MSGAVLLAWLVLGGAIYGIIEHMIDPNAVQIRYNSTGAALIRVAFGLVSIAVAVAVLLQ